VYHGAVEIQLYIVLKLVAPVLDFLERFHRCGHFDILIPPVYTFGLDGYRIGCV